MKRLNQLTKKEQSTYIQEHGVRHLGKILMDETAVKYIVENNTAEEIAYFLEHEATTTAFPGTPAERFISVKEFNLLHDYVHAADE